MFPGSMVEGLDDCRAVGGEAYKVNESAGCCCFGGGSILLLARGEQLDLGRTTRRFAGFRGLCVGVGASQRCFCLAMQEHRRIP